MKPENLLALRYIKSRKRNRLMSFLSLTSIIGIMLGVATLIVVVSVMSGFTGNLKDKLLGANAEITVSRFDNKPIDDYPVLLTKINALEGIRAASPYIYGQVLLTSENSVTGSVIRAIDPVLEGKVSRLETFMVEGTLSALSGKEGEAPSILLGRELAANLAVALGGDVTVVSPYGARGPFGMTPKMKKFRVGGIFDTGIYEYNSSMAYMSIPEAQNFFALGDKVSGISIAVAPKTNIEMKATEIGQAIKFPYWARDWMSMNKSLFSALKLEQLAMFIILTLIIIVASFNIVSMISVTVKDKRKDIAILRAYGASGGFISRVFLRQGLIVGVTGTILGDILAFVISFCLKEFKIIELPKEIYFMDKIPIEISLDVYILVTVCAITVTLLASIFPARQAAKMRPIEALRND